MVLSDAFVGLFEADKFYQVIVAKLSELLSTEYPDTAFIFPVFVSDG